MSLYVYILMYTHLQIYGVNVRACVRAKNVRHGISLLIKFAVHTTYIRHRVSKCPGLDLKSESCLSFRP
jgi:hypothetical protein